MYALVAWGGLETGKRPPARLAYIYQHRETGEWYADFISPTGRSLYLRPKKLDSEKRILHRFGTAMPGKKSINAAKKNLPRLTEVDCWDNREATFEKYGY